MIRRRTMLEEPHIAPCGMVCYFHSGTSLLDLDPFGETHDKEWVCDDGSDLPIAWGRVRIGCDTMGLRHRLDNQLRIAHLDSDDDTLVLWPTQDEVISWGLIYGTAPLTSASTAPSAAPS